MCKKLGTPNPLTYEEQENLKHEHSPTEKGDHRTHLIVMLLCCLIPIIIVLALLYANIGGEYLSALLILLCPLMHLLLMLPRRKKIKMNGT